MIIRPFAEVRKYNKRFLVYASIGDIWVTGYLLPEDDEFYTKGFLRADYTGLCPFEYWDDAPAMPFPRPTFSTTANQGD